MLIRTMPYAAEVKKNSLIGVDWALQNQPYPENVQKKLLRTKKRENNFRWP